jgi:hypothetical protein
LSLAVHLAGTTPAEPSGPRLRGSADRLLRLLVVALFAAVFLVAGQWVRRSEARQRFEVGAAWRENRALRVRQEALRSRLFELSRRLEILERGEPGDPGGARQPAVAGREVGRT